MSYLMWEMYANWEVFYGQFISQLLFYTIFEVLVLQIISFIIWYHLNYSILKTINSLISHILHLPNWSIKN